MNSIKHACVNSAGICLLLLSNIFNKKIMTTGNVYVCLMPLVLYLEINRNVKGKVIPVQAVEALRVVRG
jgi:hypothetical protein